MLKIHFTNDTVFSFSGPNLCFLGKPGDFLELAKAISELTGVEGILKVNELDFVEFNDLPIELTFISKAQARSLACFREEKNLVFELDNRGWERLFKFFVFLSWSQCTYYLNTYEDALEDLDLDQECHFICSSEF